MSKITKVPKDVKYARPGAVFDAVTYKMNDDVSFVPGESTITDYEVIRFDATYNPEEKIASALFTLSQRHPDADYLFLTTYYADGYSHYYVRHGAVRTSVIDYTEVKDYDHDKIKSLFADYKAGRAVPIEVPNIMDSLTRPADADVASLSIEDRRKDIMKVPAVDPSVPKDDVVRAEVAWNRKMDKCYAQFIEDVIANKDKTYPSQLSDTVKALYTDKETGERIEPTWFYRDNVVHMIRSSLEVKGIKREPVSSYRVHAWNVEAQIGDTLVKTTVGFDPSSIEEFGPPSDIELAGRLFGRYVTETTGAAFEEYVKTHMPDYDKPITMEIFDDKAKMPTAKEPSEKSDTAVRTQGAPTKDSSHKSPAD